MTRNEIIILPVVLTHFASPSLGHEVISRIMIIRFIKLFMLLLNQTNRTIVIP